MPWKQICSFLFYVNINSKYICSLHIKNIEIVWNRKVILGHLTLILSFASHNVEWSKQLQTENKLQGNKVSFRSNLLQSLKEKQKHKIGLQAVSQTPLRGWKYILMHLHLTTVIWLRIKLRRFIDFKSIWDCYAP